MQAGKLNRRITIRQQSTTLDAYGQEIVSWTDLCSVWASIATLSGLESVRSGIELSLIRSSMRIRYRLGITSDMRVLYGADLYEIEAILMDEQSKEHMDLICRTGAAQ